MTLKNVKKIMMNSSKKSDNFWSASRTSQMHHFRKLVHFICSWANDPENGQVWVLFHEQMKCTIFGNWCIWDVRETMMPDLFRKFDRKTRCLKISKKTWWIHHDFFDIFRWHLFDGIYEINLAFLCELSRSRTFLKKMT